jgi:S-adenosylmethionine:tRNA ribosyltransferase-isomerase
VNPKDLQITGFDYPLPPDRIPDHALPDRSASKLLCYDCGEISDRVFRDLPDILHPGDELFINNTRVIPARLLFTRKTGAVIEIFCLEPYETEYQQAMEMRGTSRWICLVGNAKKWKEPELVMELPSDSAGVELRASRMESLGEGRHVVAFSWNDTTWSFAEILEAAGRIPIPPYFRREPDPEDKERYQTVFAQFAGSVAAPTAGLHFTKDILERTEDRGVRIAEFTLHVGAGTFRPVSAEKLADHPMHGEWIDVPVSVVEQLARTSSGRRIPVGTTSMRTLESLYWLGVKCGTAAAGDTLILEQWEDLTLPGDMPAEDAMHNLLMYLNREGRNSLRARTSLLIAPGYRFRLCSGLITNFHLPKSTLLVLIAAFVGDDWKSVYEHALGFNYRFLSYGDSSLLFPGRK